MYAMGAAVAVSTITRFTSLISIIGCTAVAWQCWGLKRKGKLTHMDKLILVLCLVDLGLAISWFVGDWVSHGFMCGFQVRLPVVRGTVAPNNPKKDVGSSW